MQDIVLIEQLVCEHPVRGDTRAQEYIYQSGA